MNVQRQMYESQRNPAIPALKVFLFFIRISFFYNPWDETPVLWDEILTSSFRFQYVKELFGLPALATLSPVMGWELITIVILETKVPPHRPRAAGGTKRLVVDIKLTPINYNTTELSLNQVQL